MCEGIAFKSKKNVLCVDQLLKSLYYCLNNRTEKQVSMIPCVSVFVFWAIFLSILLLSLFLSQKKILVFSMNTEKKNTNFCICPNKNLSQCLSGEEHTQYVKRKDVDVLFTHFFHVIWDAESIFLVCSIKLFLWVYVSTSWIFWVMKYFVFTIMNAGATKK